MNATDLAETVTSWFVPQRVLELDARGPLVAGAFVLFATVAWIRVALIAKADPSGAARSKWTLVAVLSFLPLFAGFYLLSASLSHQARLSHRYLGPMLVPALVVGIGGIDALARALGSSLSRIGAGRRAGAVVSGLLVVSLLGAWVWIVPARRVAQVLRSHRVGALSDFTSIGWSEAPLTGWLVEHSDELEAPLYSNAPEALWYYTRQRSDALLTPRARPRKLRESAFVDRDATLVWFDPWPLRSPLARGGFEEFDRLSPDARVVPSPVFDDGKILRVFIPPEAGAPPERPR